MPSAIFRRPALPAALLVAALLLSAFAPASAAGKRFCGGAATPGQPSDLANVVGDQTLEFAVQQPANIVTCAKGYLLAKCGDYESAHQVFDKCVAAGYAGAMIWKALLLEEGAGVAQDSAQAAELLHRAALSDDPGYGPIGKMHYATVLHLGRGVAKNEAEAREWFAAAAAEGSEEAREFLNTGYHTGHRELNGLGAGTPTAAALVKGLTGDNASVARPLQESNPADGARQARKLLDEPTSSPSVNAPPQAASAGSASFADEVQGQKLALRDTALAPSLPVASTALGLLLLATFLTGIMRRRRPFRGKRNPAF